MKTLSLLFRIPRYFPCRCRSRHCRLRSLTLDGGVSRVRVCLCVGVQLETVFGHSGPHLGVRFLLSFLRPLTKRMNGPVIRTFTSVLLILTRPKNGVGTDIGGGRGVVPGTGRGWRGPDVEVFVRTDHQTEVTGTPLTRTLGRKGC